MNKYFKKIQLWTFMFVVLLFVQLVNADAVNNESASVSYDVINSNAQDSINETIVTELTKPDMWYRTKSGLWYYFENNWSTTRTGWFVDSRDGQTYYLRPENGIMAVGWNKIDGEDYYFNDNKEAESCWFEVGGGFYEKWRNGLPTYGSLLKDCMTPDGKMVDKDGKLIK